MPPEAPAARLGRNTSSRPWRRPQRVSRPWAKRARSGTSPGRILHTDDGGDIADEAAHFAGGEPHARPPRGVVEHQRDVAGRRNPLKQTLEVEGGDLVEGRRREHERCGTTSLGGAGEGNQALPPGARKQPTMTGTRPSTTCTAVSTTRRRSSAVRLRDSPVPPSTQRPSTPHRSWCSSSPARVSSSSSPPLGEGGEHGGDDAVQLVHRLQISSGYVRLFLALSTLRYFG